MRRLCPLLFAAFLMSAAGETPVAANARGSGPSLGGLPAQAAAGSPSSGAGAGSASAAPVYTAPLYSSGFGRAYGMRPGSTFMSGLIGGFLGAGLGGLLFGGGFFQAMHGGPGVLGVLLQLFIAYSLAVWAYRRFARSLAPVATGVYGRAFYPQVTLPSGTARPGFFAGGRAGKPITLSATDFRSFEELLHCVQTAWSAHDLDALRSLATPEMAGSYARRLADQQVRGIHNLVSDVRLQQADAREAWSDGRRDFATVSMKFSMVDVTRNASGRIVDGSETERLTVRQSWHFTRRVKGRWCVAAVEEAA